MVFAIAMDRHHQPSNVRAEVKTPPPRLEAIGAPTLDITLSPFLQDGSLSSVDYEDREAGVPIDTIILHHTGLSRRYSTATIPSSWQNDPRPGSAHFAIGADGDVIMAVPPDKTAFHILKQAAYPDPDTGKPTIWINKRSIGLEFHYDPSAETPTADQIEAGGHLIGALFNAYPDLEVRRIFGHGIQTFADNYRGRPISEPTHLFMTPALEVSTNFPKLLAAAASVSPEVARAVDEAGGAGALAAQLRQSTLAGKDLSVRLDATWQADSELPVSPVLPKGARQQLDATIAGSRPHREVPVKP